MEIELKLTKEELKYLFSIIDNYIPQQLEDEVVLYQSTKSKVEHELIADRIYDLMSDIDCISEDLEDDFFEEWENKLWCEDEDDTGFMIKRNLKMWNWDTVTEMESIVKQIEAKHDY